METFPEYVKDPGINLEVYGMIHQSLKHLSYTALFTAGAVLLSGLSFPAGPARVFPFQHAINVLAGILIGPWYGTVAALLAGLIRMSLGTGTIFSLPGGIPGVIMVGLAYRYLKKDWVAFIEPLGTGPIGATLSALVVAPYLGLTGTLAFFQSAFLASSIPGCLIGFLLVRALRKVSRFSLGEQESPGSP
ncbi:MAG TPA: energy coupling factor transporter S component ThiW [Atribacteraceae bacterium]|nr:energy coupling factor transporter S component ThiW [Atribacteraceae bacterium]